MRRTAIAAALLVLAACGGSSGATPQASSSLSPPPTSAASSSPAHFPSPTPGGLTPPPPAAVTCSSKIPLGPELALVTLRNTAGVVVRDVSNLAKPVTRCIIKGSGSYFRFVTSTRVSYIVTGDNGEGALYAVDLPTQTTSLVRAWSNGGSLYWVYAWSPDGTTLSYLSSNGDKVAWHVLSSAGDVVLSDLGSIPGRGVDPNSDDVMVGFSADGQYVALEHTFNGSPAKVAPFQVVRLLNHKLVYSRSDGTMATWATGAGERLYFRTSSGLEAWDIAFGAVSIVPQGFRWIHPWPSADGTRIAYVDADSKGNHFPGYVRVSDGQAIRVSSRPRAGAAFLTDDVMWYAEESVCSSQCSLGEPKLTGRTYIYDVVAKTESASIITSFFDSWPRFA